MFGGDLPVTHSNRKPIRQKETGNRSDKRSAECAYAGSGSGKGTGPGLVLFCGFPAIRRFVPDIGLAVEARIYRFFTVLVFNRIEFLGHGYSQ
jgi:hypothetical protein